MYVFISYLAGRGCEVCSHHSGATPGVLISQIWGEGHFSKARHRITGQRVFVSLGDPCHNLSTPLALVVLPLYLVSTFPLRQVRVNNKKWNDWVIGCICICKEVLHCFPKWPQYLVLPPAIYEGFTCSAASLAFGVTSPF